MSKHHGGVDDGKTVPDGFPLSALLQIHGKVLVQTGLEWRNIRHGFASAYRQKLSGLEMGQSANREMQADFYCRNSQVEENAVSSA